ncbi:MAG: extracellular solute-binding protein [Bauldia sp.]|uniref:extracellular solute-binding protein n=1 Tax=Bauldia sp. TaxID=2575872 RepID=UPI001D26B8FF|nr:extracellular solute-binding protein [Bauldia sp.]MCB1497812.1 extracellular solute-binding protein [Bauldia sp.]
MQTRLSKIAAIGLAALMAGVGAVHAENIVVTGVSSFKLIEDLLPEFEEQSGIDVDLQILPYPQLRQNSMADLVGGTANSDVYMQDITWLGEWATNGYVRPLDDLIERDSAEVDLDDILPGAFDSLSKWDGKTWSMPFGAYYFLMYYRSDLFDKAGIAPPKTFADITAAADKLTDPSANLWGIAMPYRRGTPIASWFLATYTGAGGRLLPDAPQDFTPSLDTPLALDTLTAYLKWLEDAPSGAIDYHWNDQTVAMQTGRIAMAGTFSINGTEFAKPDVSLVSDAIGYTYMPVAKEGDPNTIPFGGWAVAINANTDKVEPAWKFIKWVSSPDVQRRLGALNGTPMRSSAMSDPDLQKMYPWLPFILDAEEAGIVYPDYRPRYPFYPKVEEALGLELNRAALGEITAEEALSNAQSEIKKIISDAGYPVKG